MVALAQSKPDWETRVDTDRAAISDKEIPTLEIARDRSSLLFCERTGPLAGAERAGRGRSGARGGVVIVVLVRDGRDLGEGGVDVGRGGGRCGGCGKRNELGAWDGGRFELTLLPLHRFVLGVRIGASGAKTAL